MKERYQVLVVYGTTEGQTEKVARFVADRLREHGHQTQVFNATDVPAETDPAGFNAVVIAASIHVGRYQSSIIHFVRSHRAQLETRPNVFISVSLAAAGADEDDIDGLRKCVADFVHETGWTPQHIHHAAGAFRYTTYDFLKRWAMKYIAYRKGGPTDVTHDHELTDWNALRRFLDAFEAELESR